MKSIDSKSSLLLCSAAVTKWFMLHLITVEVKFDAEGKFIQEYISNPLLIGGR